MSASPRLSASLALLFLGAPSLAHTRDADTRLGIRLIIADSCDIHSGTGEQRANGGDIRIACAAGTPHELSFSHPAPPADAMVSQPLAPAVAPAPESQPAGAEPRRQEFPDRHDAPTTTVTF